MIIATWRKRAESLATVHPEPQCTTPPGEGAQISSYKSLGPTFSCGPGYKTEAHSLPGEDSLLTHQRAKIRRVPLTTHSTPANCPHVYPVLHQAQRAPWPGDSSQRAHGHPPGLPHLLAPKALLARSLPGSSATGGLSLIKGASRARVLPNGQWPCLSHL